MNLKDYSKAELEAMSYDDIAYMILNESKKKMKINELFEKVCELLELSEKVFTDKIGDFFEVLSTDQRFIMLSDGYWDLKNKYSGNKIIIDDEDEDTLVDALEESDDYEEETDVYYDADETDDQDEDDLKDLVIIDEDEENNDLN